MKFDPIKCCVLNFSKRFILSTFISGREGGGGEGVHWRALKGSKSELIHRGIMQKHEHKFRHNAMLSGVMLKSTMLEFSRIICLTLLEVSNQNSKTASRKPTQGHK